MEQAAALLHRFPELSLFLSIVIGHVIGRLHYKGVGLGAVVGTLIAGICIGIFAKPQLPDLLRWAFFYLFLFSIGYSVGPQFFGSLRKAALPQIGLALVVALTGLGTAIGLSILLDFDEGTAVGILSGGMTQSAALGTGLNAIAELPIDEALKAKLSANAPLADAITYGFGDLGLILFLTLFGPLLMRADLRREAKVLEQQLSGGKPAGTMLPGARFGFRAYRIDHPAFVHTVASLEERYAQGRVAVQRVKRSGELLPVEPSLKLQVGDLAVLSGQRAALAQFERDVGAEVDDAGLLAIPIKTATVVLTRREAHGRSLEQLAADRGMARGVYLLSVKRGEVELPFEPWTTVERGDLVRIVGTPEDVERAAAHIGFVERDLAKTDLSFLAGGICLGILLGLLKVKFGDLALGLGTAGSILVVGLLAGWARSRYPVFGSIPEPAQRLLADIGLIVFIAAVGLTAGPHAVEAYQHSGARYFGSIFLAGMVVTMAPLIVGLVFARWVLGMNPMMVIGALAGAQTCTPGLNALREASGSNVGVLAYTVPYAIGNILLTIWGPVVVAVMHAIRS
jgi:putative transport protein